MANQLKFGISGCFFHADPQRPIFKGKTLVYLEQSLAEWAMSQGALAYLIPPVPSHGQVTLEALVQGLDGLVLQGGSDVSPRSYGETALKPEWNGDYVRDQYEIALTRAFLAQGKPVLGVCRGAQLLNVAFGGTLYQDIATQVPGALPHRNWDIYDQNWHEITLEKGSLLEQLHGPGGARKVNSIHHQAVKDLGKGMKAEARATDGIIEAIRLDDDREWVCAVQWHPEFHQSDEAVRALGLLNGAPLLAEFMSRARRN